MSSPDPILDRGAAHLARAIAAGELSARDATRAFIARLEKLQPILNALTVARFETAFSEAAAADERQARGDSLGPLHGVPITVKECFQLAGTPVTLGLRARKNRLDVEDGELVRRLRESGAIVLGKSNVPQLMTYTECDNPLFGRTNNPWNLNRTCGGSSGGEAALLAAGGATLGLGSDLGGSIRIPAHFCGLHGLKPTSGRLPDDDSLRAFRGMETIGAQAGPMSRHVADLSLAMQTLTRDSALRDGRPPIPALGSLEEMRGLRVGYWIDDGFMAPSPAIARAVREAAAALAGCGVAVEEFAPPDVHGAMRTYFGILGADGGADFSRWVAGDEIDPRVARLIRLAGTPSWLRPLSGWLLDWWGEPLLAELFAASGSTSADGYWRLTRAARHYERDFARMCDERGIDLLLAPPFALPAFPHGRSMDLLPAASYAMLVNLLGWPCGVVAATCVRAGEESSRAAGGDVVNRRAVEAEQGSVGLPVGVQVVARPWREDRLLLAMAALERHFSAQADYPLWPEVSANSAGLVGG